MNTALDEMIAKSWKTIAPFWPLKNLIAVNPLAGFEDQPISEALQDAWRYFQQHQFPPEIDVINRESIKWLKAYFDTGQSRIPLPLQHLDFLDTMIQLLCHDQRLIQNRSAMREWLKNCPHNPVELIETCLQKLSINPEHQQRFLTLMLTTLPGWAAYAEYLSMWAKDASMSREAFLAFRLLIACLVWPQPHQLLSWFDALRAPDPNQLGLQHMQSAENVFHQRLFSQLTQQRDPIPESQPDVQSVFCIDIRSEPFRRALESTGNHQTYGFAGFFGLTISVSCNGKTAASCPVLIQPTHTVKQITRDSGQVSRRLKQCWHRLTEVFQSINYAFTTPLALVETLAPAIGIWMSIKTFWPNHVHYFKSLNKHRVESLDISAVPLSDQTTFAENFLKTIGLTHKFSPLIMLCAHESETLNNAHASALDCGACGGRSGAANARVMAMICNTSDVRVSLAKRGIHVPDSTHFIAAVHQTTTDDVTLYEAELPEAHLDQVAQLKVQLKQAQQINLLQRAQALELDPDQDLQKATQRRKQDWAQVRPEWGLAGNAALIIAPRSLTTGIDLEGRVFLHDYQCESDLGNKILEVILTAPLIVAQWINAQYLFSTLDSVAFGAGSKVTQNIAGKIGVMQGNASDLMTGLSIQSVKQDDTTQHHQPVRLTTIVRAPQEAILAIVKKHPNLTNLIAHEWLHLFSIHPSSHEITVLRSNLTWGSSIAHAV